jgi:SH3-like domain-containing protein
MSFVSKHHNSTAKNANRKFARNVTRTLLLGSVCTLFFAVTGFAQEGDAEQLGYAHSPFLGAMNTQISDNTPGAWGVVNTDSTNLRSVADRYAQVIGTLDSGDEIVVRLLDGEFFQVSVNGNEEIFIYHEFVDVPEWALDNLIRQTASYAVVTANRLNLRSAPNVDSRVVLSLTNGMAVDVVEVWPNWAKVEFGAFTGFLNRDYISLHVGEKPEQPYSALGVQIALYAQRYMGTPWIWGGTSLTRGVDCSGFTWAVFRHFGINLNRVACCQATQGVFVDRGSLQPGDLVFFDTNWGWNTGRISHVGIYIGNGQFVHSGGSRSAVMIDRMSDPYYVRTFVTARRII